MALTWHTVKRSILPWEFNFVTKKVKTHGPAPICRLSVFFFLLPTQLNSNLGHPSLIFEEKKTHYHFKFPLLCLLNHLHMQIHFMLTDLSLSLSLSLSLVPLCQFISLSLCLSACFFNIVLSFYPQIDKTIASSVQSRYWRHTHTHLL